MRQVGCRDASKYEQRQIQEITPKEWSNKNLKYHAADMHDLKASAHVCSKDDLTVCYNA